MILIIQEKLRRHNMLLEKYHLNFLVRDDIKIVKDDYYYHLRTEYKFMKHTDLFMFDFKLSKGKNFSELESNILQLAEKVCKLKAFL